MARRREADSEEFIRPQERYADIVVSFLPGDGDDPEHLTAELVLRPTLQHPDLAPFIDENGISLADEVLVLDHGRVVARETQAELAESSPVYREIYEHGLIDRELAARLEASA